MPTNNETQFFDSYVQEGGLSSRKAYIGHSVTKYSFTWPDSVRRPFPDDLFGSGTGRTTTEVKRRDSGVSFHVGTNPRRFYTDYPISQMYTLPASPTVAIDKEKIYNKIRSDIRGDATNLGVMLAEYGQTAKMFFELARVLATNGKSLLKRHPGIRRGTLNSYSKDASSAYLAFTYGVSPFLADTVGIIQALRERLETKPIVLQGVESRTERATDKRVLTSTGLGFPRADAEALRVFRQRVQWRATLDSNALLNVLVAHGMANLPLVVWEKIPFSFVADWWVNIGEALATLDNLLLVKSIEVIDSTSDRQLWYVTPRPTDRYFNAGSYTYYSRRDIRSAPRSISRVNSLRYKPNVSIKHIMNGLALLNQLR